MSVAAVMLVRDEADIIGHTVEWLLTQVDRVYVSDNGSTDGTWRLLENIQAAHIDATEGKSDLMVLYDSEVGYWQSRKTTELAMLALEHGFDWVVPVDADEFWYAPDGRAIRELLAGVAPDVQIVKAPLFNHLPTARDLPEHEEPNPFKRLGWRQREHGVLGKVACRLRPDLTILAGNHGATTGGNALSSSGLVVRHFSWRSVEQYVRKIRNGAEAYRATDLDPSTGQHWRMWDDQPDEALADHFRYWFWSAFPEQDDSLIYDPAPGVT